MIKKYFFLLFIFFLNFQNIDSKEILVEEDGVYDLIISFNNPLYYSEYIREPLNDYCNKDNYSKKGCDFKNNNLHNLYKIDDPFKKLKYIIDVSRNNIYINNQNELDQIKFDENKSNKQFFEYKEINSYSLSKVKEKKISNIWNYFNGISYINTSRNEDQADWHLYEFKPRYKLSSNKYKQHKHIIELITENKILPTFINIKSGNNITTLNDYLISNDFLSFDSKSEKIDRIYLWFKYNPEIRSIKHKIIEITLKKNKENTRELENEENITNLCKIYFCKFSDFNSIKTVKELDIHNNKIRFVINDDKKFDQIDLIFKNTYYKFENLFVKINDNWIKLDKKNDYQFHLKNIYLKKGDLLKSDIYNFNSYNLSLEKKQNSKVKKSINKYNFIFMLILFFLILFKFSNFLVFLILLILLLINSYYIMSLITFLLLLVNLKILKDKIIKICFYLFIILIAAYFFVTLIDINILFSEIIINTLYLIIITTFISHKNQNDFK